MADDKFIDPASTNAFENLPKEHRENLLAMADDFRNGPLGDAFREFADVVGQEEAMSIFMQMLLGGQTH
jgi:hypothetical protein